MKKIFALFVSLLTLFFVALIVVALTYSKSFIGLPNQFSQNLSDKNSFFSSQEIEKHSSTSQTNIDSSREAISEENIEETTTYSFTTIDLDSNKSELIFSNQDYYTQGLCSYGNGIFISQKDVYIQEDYHIFKIEFQDELNVLNSEHMFNHANGMAFNSFTNEIYVCMLSSSDSSECNRLNDYSFAVVDSITFEIKKVIDLYDIINNVCPDSIGMCGIAYNSITKKTYILTRKPKRYVITLNEDFSYCDSFFLCDYSDNVIFGDLSSFDDYLITCYWNIGQSSVSNIVSFYSLDGCLIKEIELYGLTHIESIDKFDNRLIANFNDFSNGACTKVFAIDVL